MWIACFLAMVSAFADTNCFVRPEWNTRARRTTATRRMCAGAAFLDKGGDGVLCKGSVPLYVQALHYSVDELDLQRHRGAGTWSDESKERFYAPMFPRKEIMLNFDIRQLGLGNGSCGPGTLECYAFPNRREEWTITFVPVKGGDYNALRSAASRVGQTIPEKSAVRSRRASGMGFDGG